MYLDKLDGRVDGAFFDKMSAQWREEQNRCLREIARHESAEQSYMDEGVQILELAHFKPKMLLISIRRIAPVSDLTYAGDEGGILCHIVPRDEQQALFISLTHVRMPRKMPLAGGGHRLSKASPEEAEEARLRLCPQNASCALIPLNRCKLHYRAAV